MVRFAYYESPFGIIKISHGDGIITGVTLVESSCSDHCPSPVSDLAAAQLQEYFAGSRKTFSFPLSLKGTSFQLVVWNALLSIPYGETRSYKEIAEAVGNPKAFRAVGMACNRNPVWIAVPCHRVVGSDRSLTGYEGGLHIKQALLELESSNL